MSPLTKVPFTAVCSSATVGANSSGSSGTAYVFGASGRSASVIAVNSAGSQRLATTAAVCARCGAQLGQADLDGVNDLLDAAVLARTANTTGAPRLTAMRAFTLSSAGLATSV